MTIHILGVGAIGGLLAHSLRRTNQSIVLCLRNKEGFDGSITVEGFGKSTRVDGFQFEIINSEKYLNNNDKISTLIVSTKAFDIKQAINSVRKRLHSQSIIVLIHNGMGVYEEVLELFSEENRPSFVIGVTSHGSWRKSRYHIIHAGFGSFYISSIGQPSNAKESIIEKLTQTNLGIRKIPYMEMQRRQLEKLIINSSLNPITAIMQVQNGHVSKIPNLLENLCIELCPILNAYCMENNIYPSFNAQELLKVSMNVIETTKENNSSMFQDTLAKQPTEIDYINGYLCRLGKKYEIPTPINNVLLELLKMREMLLREK